MSTKAGLSGVGSALASATLFGLSASLAKLMLARLSPVMLAGLLYGGSGVGLGAWWIARRIGGFGGPAEAPLVRRDLPWLAGSVLFGGILGPLLLMTGIQRTTASTASLLLNMEGVFTALLAVLIFKEYLGPRVITGFSAILAGGALLSWSGRPEWSGLLGPLAIALACLCWGIDNNLTRFISAGDPVQIAGIKGFAAGMVNLTLAIATGSAVPSWQAAGEAGLIGFFGYGVSLVLFITALRHLGTVRTGAYFSTAPFIGVAASIILLRESPTLMLASSALLMAFGVWLHLTEHHEHEHVHEYLKHTHLHTHDEHHRHDHAVPVDPGVWHTHEHEHLPMTHTHPHFPDIHHRHGHRHSHD